RSGGSAAGGPAGRPPGRSSQGPPAGGRYLVRRRPWHEPLPPGAHPLAKKRRLRGSRPAKLLLKVAKFLIKSQLLTAFLLLFALGFWAGSSTRPDDEGTVPYAAMFENLSVLSYRETPSDSIARFVVQLSAGGRVFREYDVDEHRFDDPVRGRDYRRTISGTRYGPLKVRGHVDRGFSLELYPDA